MQKIKKVARFILSRSFYLVLGVAISASIYFAQAAWNDIVADGTPLTPTLWNDLVAKVDEINSVTENLRVDVKIKYLFKSCTTNGGGTEISSGSQWLDSIPTSAVASSMSICGYPCSASLFADDVVLKVDSANLITATCKKTGGAINVNVCDSTGMDGNYASYDCPILELF